MSGLMAHFLYGAKMKRGVAYLNDNLAAVVTNLGYEFVGCELLKQGRGSLLRIYIDSPKGITVDDCSKVSHQVSALLDVEDPIPGHYTLEVSSPGINRPLFEIAHFKKYIGSTVKIRLCAAIDGTRNIVGILSEVSEENIHLLVDAEKKVIPFSEIEKAKLIEY